MWKHRYALKKRLRVESCQVNQKQVCLTLPLLHCKLIKGYILLFTYMCQGTDASDWVWKGHAAARCVMTIADVLSASSVASATVVFPHIQGYLVGNSWEVLQDWNGFRSRQFFWWTDILKPPFLILLFAWVLPAVKPLEQHSSLLDEWLMIIFLRIKR